MSRSYPIEPEEATLLARAHARITRLEEDLDGKDATIARLRTELEETQRELRRVEVRLEELDTGFEEFAPSFRADDGGMD